MADGHILDLLYLRTSAQSPGFIRALLDDRSNIYAGRLNLGESTLVNTNLSVSIASSTANVQPGQSFDYLVSVQNSGPDAATNSGVSIAVPTSVSVVSVPSGCTLLGQIFTCPIGTLAAAQSVAFSIRVRAVTPSSVVATAYAYSDSYDYVSTDNAAGADVIIQSPSAGSDGDVPTLPEWGAMLMGSLLLWNMAWVQRRKNRG